MRLTDEGAMNIFSETIYCWGRKKVWLERPHQDMSDCGMSTFHRSFQTGVKTLQHVRIQKRANDDSIPLYCHRFWSWWNSKSVNLCKASFQDPTESLKITWACFQLLCLASLSGAVVPRIKLCLPTILSTLKVGHCQLIVCSIAL